MQDLLPGQADHRDTDERCQQRPTRCTQRAGRSPPAALSTLLQDRPAHLTRTGSAAPRLAPGTGYPGHSHPARQILVPGRTRPCVRSYPQGPLLTAGYCGELKVPKFGSHMPSRRQKSWELRTEKVMLDFAEIANIPAVHVNAPARRDSLRAPSKAIAAMASHPSGLWPGTSARSWSCRSPAQQPALRRRVPGPNATGSTCGVSIACTAHHV